MRDKIDKLDAKIAELLDERMDIARQIGEEKRQDGRAIFDEAREREILLRNKYPRVWQEILEASRCEQLRICLDRNVVLVGMMGSGKTTIGKLLAEMIGIDFADTDEEVGGNITEIFKTQGETAFREMERAALARVFDDKSFGGELSAEKVRVIATGGGVILNPDNRELLKRGYVFFLNRPIDVIRASVDGEGRPLFASLEQVYEQRLSLYKEVADFEITGNLAPESAARQILRCLQSIEARR